MDSDYVNRYTLLYNLPCSRKIKRIDEAKRCGTRSSAGGQVTSEIPPKLCLLVHATKERLFVNILESEVERLCWEVSNNVR